MRGLAHQFSRSSWWAYPPLSLRDISPSRGEIDPYPLLKFRQTRKVCKVGAEAQPISPLEGEMSDRTEGGMAPIDEIAEVHP